MVCITYYIIDYYIDFTIILSRQWTSFLSGISTALYIYIYSIYYFFFNTKLVLFSKIVYIFNLNIYVYNYTECTEFSKLPFTLDTWHFSACL